MQDIIGRQWQGTQNSSHVKGREMIICFHTKKAKKNYLF